MLDDKTTKASVEPTQDTGPGKAPEQVPKPETEQKATILETKKPEQEAAGLEKAASAADR